MHLILLLVWLAARAAAQTECAGTPLTPEETVAGWKDLSQASQWSGGIEKPLPEGAWKFENECIVLADPKRGESIYSVEPYENFELSFDWAIAQGGNSGLKYAGVRGRRHPDLFKYILYPLGSAGLVGLVALLGLFYGIWKKKFQSKAALWAAMVGAFLLADGVCYAAARWFSIYQDAKYYPTGLEYQVIDNDRHPDGKKPNHRTGSLYDMLAPTGAEPLPVGQFNRSRIIVNGKHVEHWLNGRQVLSYEFGSDQLKQALAQSKFARLRDMSDKFGGYLELQNHGDQVWFRNMRIRVIQP